jgi:hypothetical protein
MNDIAFYQMSDQKKIFAVISRQKCPIVSQISCVCSTPARIIVRLLNFSDLGDFDVKVHAFPFSKWEKTYSRRHSLQLRNWPRCVKFETLSNLKKSDLKKLYEGLTSISESNRIHLVAIPDTIEDFEPSVMLRFSNYCSFL